MMSRNQGWTWLHVSTLGIQLFFLSLTALVSKKLLTAQKSSHRESLMCDWDKRKEKRYEYWDTCCVLTMWVLWRQRNQRGGLEASCLDITGLKVQGEFGRRSRIFSLWFPTSLVYGSSFRVLWMDRLLHIQSADRLQLHGSVQVFPLTSSMTLGNLFFLLWFPHL